MGSQCMVEAVGTSRRDEGATWLSGLVYQLADSWLRTAIGELHVFPAAALGQFRFKSVAARIAAGSGCLTANRDLSHSPGERHRLT